MNATLSRRPLRRFWGWGAASEQLTQEETARISMMVQDGVSNHVAATVWTSLIVFTLLYGALGVVWFMLQRRYIIEGPATYDARPPGHSDDADSDEPKQLSFAY